MTHARNKGVEAELEVRDLLLAWWSKIEPLVKIARTPLSGGWQSAATFKARGDLMVSPTSRFPWCVEVKRRERWAPGRFVTGHASPVWGWWAQVTQAAHDTTQEHGEVVQPMLWCRRSRGHWIVLLPLAQAIQQRWPVTHRYCWNAGQLERLGVEIPPVGYWAEDLLSSNPRWWVLKPS